MVEIVNMHETKTHFSKLVAKVEAGEEIVIARGGRPCARLVPLDDLDEALHDLQAGQLPIDVPAAVAAGRLDWEHRDPFDRMLAAQAALGGFSLLTVERAFDRAGIALALS